MNNSSSRLKKLLENRALDSLVTLYLEYKDNNKERDFIKLVERIQRSSKNSKIRESQDNEEVSKELDENGRVVVGNIYEDYSGHYYIVQKVVDEFEDLPSKYSRYLDTPKEGEYDYFVGVKDWETGELEAYCMFEGEYTLGG